MQNKSSTVQQMGIAEDARARPQCGETMTKKRQRSEQEREHLGVTWCAFQWKSFPEISERKDGVFSTKLVRSYAG